jgi:hypothetical protein
LACPTDTNFIQELRALLGNQMTNQALFSLLLVPALLLLAACPPIDDCVCPTIDEPVCGEDGATYGNSCIAACADVAVAQDGPCAGDGDDDDSANGAGE